MAENNTQSSLKLFMSNPVWMSEIITSFKKSIGIHPAIQSLRQKLFWRLSITGIIVALILSSIVYFSERRNVADAVSSHALEVAAKFNEQINTLLDNSELPSSEIIREKIEVLFVAGNIKHQQGRIVYLGVYDQRGYRIGNVIDEEYRHIDAVKIHMANNNYSPPGIKQNRYKSTSIGGVPHVKLSIPLLNSSGKMVARVEELVAVSPKVIAEIEARILKTILTVFSIVITATLVFYPIYRTLLTQQLKLTQDLVESNLEILQVLGSAIAKRDSETDNHNYRVTIYAVSLAEAVFLNKRAIQSLIKGAFLHDVGKIGISDAILLKPGQLSAEEFDTMKKHVQHGIDIVQRSAWLKDAAGIVKCHHEKYDGNGYPLGLKGEAIPIGARIFAIADVFDALISRRPYKSSVPLEDTIDMIRVRGGIDFDPDLVKVFVSIIEPIYREINSGGQLKLRRKMEVIVDKYFSRISEVSDSG